MSASNARKCTAIARVHSFAPRVHLEAEASKLNSAIAARLKELGYGS
ncbi:MAG: hypothetical protein HY778_09945 [Betaproteobacteria bacterium]|nr:hypothetical protein [Betaproteobacteria bacterium]